MVLHCICSAAVKVSVESNVESLVSRFENHFGKNRQLSEEHALEEMLIAENGPILVHADSIIRKSLNSYFREHNPTDAGKWHFIKVRSRIQENTNKSLVMERMMKEKSKLSFMDNEWKWGIIPLTLFWNDYLKPLHQCSDFTKQIFVKKLKWINKSYSYHIRL